jgi:hypothetical protein
MNPLDVDSRRLGDLPHGTVIWDPRADEIAVVEWHGGSVYLRDSIGLSHVTAELQVDVISSSVAVLPHAVTLSDGDVVYIGGT